MNAVTNKVRCNSINATRGPTIALKAGREVVGKVGGRLEAGGGGGTAAAGFSSSGHAPAGAGPVDVLLGGAGLPYKDAAEVVGLLEAENAGRVEEGGGGGFGVLGLCAFLNSLISILPTGV